MNIQEYINSYAEWLKSEISFTKVGEYYEINTPFQIMIMIIFNFTLSKMVMNCILRTMDLLSILLK